MLSTLVLNVLLFSEFAYPPARSQLPSSVLYPPIEAVYYDFFIPCFLLMTLAFGISMEFENRYQNIY